MTREVRIGCVQTRPLATFDEAIEEARRLAGDAVAAGAELVCLPEYCGGLKSEGGLFAPPTAPKCAIRCSTRCAASRATPGYGC